MRQDRVGKKFAETLDPQVFVELKKYPPVIPMREAAKIMGVTNGTIRRYCNQGRIRHKRISNEGKKGRIQIFIDTASLLRFLGVDVKMEP